MYVTATTSTEAVERASQLDDILEEVKGSDIRYLQAFPTGFVATLVAEKAFSNGEDFDMFLELIADED